MKKLINILFILAFMGSCSMEVRPRNVGTSPPIMVNTDVCINSYDPYPIDWASYCDMNCCYYEFYSEGWICEEAWCFDSYFCEWEYMGEICY